MAAMVRVGDTIINVDLVTQVYFKPGSVRVYFVAATGKGDDRHLDVVEFFGRDATALRTFLEANCDDVSKLVAPEPE